MKEKEDRLSKRKLERISFEIFEKEQRGIRIRLRKREMKRKATYIRHKRGLHGWNLELYDKKTREQVEGVS